MSQIPDGLQYSPQHVWVRGEVIEGNTVVVGITEHAAAALGDIIYVESPTVGAEFAENEICGEVESTKTVSELYCPVSGTVVAVNEAVNASPLLINQDPYGEGWLFEVEVTEASEELLDSSAYSALLS